MPDKCDGLSVCNPSAQEIGRGSKLVEVVESVSSGSRGTPCLSKETGD